MRPTPSSPQRSPQPASRKRRVAPPASRQPAAATVAPSVTSGVAYFTFSDTGELIITSYELAAALRKAGGARFVDGGGVSVGVYAGVRARKARPAAPKRAEKRSAAGTAPNQLMAAGSSPDKGYTTEDDPQLDSMCMCDVKC